MFAPFALPARAKVNLALHVLGRRADGYHDLDSIVAFADLGDRLTFSPSPDFALTVEGPFAAGLPDADDNIIARAWSASQALAAARGKHLPPVHVHLEKVLPVASGIGGGSADAAAAIRGFLRIAGIDPFDAQAHPDVLAAALAIGADVPVCLAGRACRMRGVGEMMTPLEGFRPLPALLVNPGVAVATPAVFGRLGLARGQSHREPIGNPDDPACWRNDLAAPAMALAPVIGDVLAALERQSGVIRAFMSGSGATCVALLDGGAVTPRLPPEWWAAPVVLS